MNSIARTIKARLGVAALTLTLILAVAGCAGTPFGGQASNSGTVAAAAPATVMPSPTPVILSTPSGKDASAASAANRRLATTTMSYNGEIIAATIVPVVAQVGGQIEEVRVKVGAAVRKGYVVVRIDSGVF